MIYISGGISNNPDYENQFLNAEGRLIRQNYTVVNPVNVLWNLPRGLTWSQYMDVSLELLKMCDAIYMLKGWEKSEGARVEYHYAVGCGKPVFFEEQEDE